jgi:hypothetical protein
MKTSQTNSNTSSKYFKLGSRVEYDKSIPRKLMSYVSQEPYSEVERTYTNKHGQVKTQYVKEPNDLKFVESFCYSINISMKTFLDWTKLYPELELAHNRAQEIILEHIVINTSLNLYPGTFSQFILKNISSWTDKKDIELSGKVDSQLFFEQMLSNSRVAIDNERLINNNN